MCSSVDLNWSSSVLSSALDHSDRNFNFIHFLSANRGVFTAFAIIGLWAVSLVSLLSVDITRVSIVLILAAMVWQMFLYTGLFVTAHDAMHGVVAPKRPKLNNFIGAVALRLYALFSFKHLSKAHWLHHQHPASAADPDYHDGEHDNFVTWYLHFMLRYWSWRRLLGLMLVFNGLSFGLHVPQANLIWFWMVPSIASSVQLFLFGTYLPHREPPEGYQNAARARSNDWSTFWSFITCYHFGYHREHHDYPHVAWWQLPAVHRAGNTG